MKICTFDQKVVGPIYEAYKTKLTLSIRCWLPHRAIISTRHFLTRRASDTSWESPPSGDGQTAMHAISISDQIMFSFFKMRQQAKCAVLAEDEDGSIDSRCLVAVFPPHRSFILGLNLE